MTDLDAQFKRLYPQIKSIVGRRKGKWTLTTLAWEDVESILITHIYRKLHLYDTKRPFENWANTLISSQWSNLLRNEAYKYLRPCISGSPSGGCCAFNQGSDRCGFTRSGKQCNECPLYAKWQTRKEAEFNIKAGLPLDSHAQEVQNLQEHFFDVEASKLIMDRKVMGRLNTHDASIYRMLFVEHMTMEEVGKKLKYKASSNSNVSQVLRKLVTRFKQIVRDILAEEDIV